MKNSWVIIIALGLLLLCCLAHAKPSDSKIVRIEIKGLVCPFCAYGLEKRLKETGAKTAKIYIDKGLAQIVYPEKKPLDIDQLKEAVRRGGFTPGSIEIEVKGTVDQQDGRWIFEGSGSEDFFLLKMDQVSEKLVKETKKGMVIRISAKVETISQEGHGEHPAVLRVLSYDVGK